MPLSPLDDLAQASARIGADPLLVQGPGGNSSLKLGDLLWVKASGRWLAAAVTEPIFVPLSLQRVRSAIAEGRADFADAIQSDLATPGLRPSIESALHALLPQPAVLHVHSVNAMTTAMLVDGEDRLRRTLPSSIRAAWVSYRRPGAPLADAVAERLKQGHVDVLVLENHGLVVAADTVAAAESLLREVEERLALPERAWPGVDEEAGLRLQTATYVMDMKGSGAALDAESVRFLSEAPRMPDQVVFLGGAVCLSATGDVDAAAASTKARTGIAPVLVVAPGVGVFRRRDRSASADAVIEALLSVAARLPVGVGVRGLSAQQTSELLGWEAEHYRQRMNADAGA